MTVPAEPDASRCRPGDVIHVVYEHNAYGFGLVFGAEGQLKGALTDREVRSLKGTERIIDPKARASFSEPWQERAIFAFNRYFGRCFRGGSPVTDSYDEFAPHLRKLLGDRVEGRVLDLGAGAHRYLQALDGGRLISCDIALADRAPQSDKSFVLASGAQLPFRSSSFSLVLCLFVLEHVAATEPVVAEISRLLAPGGRAFLAFPSERVSTVLAARLLGRKVPLSLHHLRSFGLIPYQFVVSTDSLRKQLRADGCRVQARAIGLRSPQFLGEWLRRKLRTLYPFSDCGSQTLLIAEKARPC